METQALQDYYAFGMEMPDRSYNAGGYRYGYNGKENDKETNWQDYGLRLYDPRVCRFPSVDPLTKSYPELTPYHFASNTPIQFIDLDGLEPASPSTDDSPDQIEVEQGTNEFYNWTRDCKNGWTKGSSVTFTYTHEDARPSPKDNTLNPDGVNGDNCNDNMNCDVAGSFFTLNTFNENESVRHADWRAAIYLATSRSWFIDQDAGALCTIDAMVENFEFGGSHGLQFTPWSTMSQIVEQDPKFIEYSNGFESKALAYYNSHGGTIEGFNFEEVMRPLGTPSIKTTWMGATLIGGTKQWATQIQAISANSILVKYTITDIFGAGLEDANRAFIRLECMHVVNYPGLSSMHWLQHNSGNPTMFTPFVWSVEVVHSAATHGCSWDL